jgi:hypothetical protein
MDAVAEFQIGLQQFVGHDERGNTIALIPLANSAVPNILPRIWPFVEHKRREHPMRKQRPGKLKG